MEDLTRLIISHERIENIKNNNLELSKEEAHYLNKVMRIKNGKKIFGNDPDPEREYVLDSQTDLVKAHIEANPDGKVAAMKDAVRSGFKTLSECIAESGGDVDELLVQRQAELARLDEMNIVTDSDPSATTQSGGSQFKPVGSIDPFGDTLEPTGEDAENVSEEASGNY